VPLVGASGAASPTRANSPSVTEAPPNAPIAAPARGTMRWAMSSATGPDLACGR